MDYGVDAVFKRYISDFLTVYCTFYGL